MPDEIEDPEAVSSGNRVDSDGVVEPPTENNSRRAAAGKVVSLPIYRPFVVPEIEALNLKNGDHYLPCLFRCDESVSSTETPFFIGRRRTGTIYHCRYCSRVGIYRRPHKPRVSAA